MINVGYEPVGRYFEAYLRRKKHEKSTSLGSDAKNEDDGIDDSSQDELSEDDKAFLLSLNSAEWKKQDHYRVLGIKSRHEATEDEIKKSCMLLMCFHIHSSNF